MTHRLWQGWRGQEQHIGGSQHWREGIVQIMGHATGQDAEAFDALGAVKLGLEELEVGDIGVHHQQQWSLPRVALDGGTATEHRDRLARLGFLIEFPLPKVRFWLGRRAAQPQHIPVLLKQIIDDLAQGVCRCPAIQALGPQAPKFHPALPILHINGIRDLINQRGLVANMGLGLVVVIEGLLKFGIGGGEFGGAGGHLAFQMIVGRLQLLLHLLARGNVSQQPQQGQGFSLGIVPHRHRNRHGQCSLIPTEEGDFPVLRSAGGC